MKCYSGSLSLMFTFTWPKLTVPDQRLPGFLESVQEHEDQVFDIMVFDTMVEPVGSYFSGSEELSVSNIKLFSPYILNCSQVSWHYASSYSIREGPRNPS
jgi:hypothetical protein